jgi:HSP20 family molecular chaperone IbpA
MKPKIRYSFPGRIYDLLLTDDKFLQEVSKLKKIENSFPRYDQWKDESGFHISFALAGYSQEDVSITIHGRQILLSADGLEDITKAELILEDKPLEEGDDDTYDKKVRTSVHKGYVSRGIARRSFRTHLYISEEFDLNGAKAKMEHGLLHIFVPEITIEERKIEIN